MKDVEFPLFKTKVANSPDFDLTNPADRKQYFELKAGDEIKRLREYLENGNTFVAYLLGKKNSGKGTYAKMLQEIVAPDKIEHFSIGDMVRRLDEVVQDDKKLNQLISFLTKNYRGYHNLEEIIKALKERNTQILLPSELVLALVKMEMQDKPKKALFIDGFPRNLDQVSYSLFFRDLIGYREDPDVFVLIDVPEAVIDERIKYRKICPQCQTSRHLNLLPTSLVGYDKEKDEFYLICDNPACDKVKMVSKEGDEKGIEPIRGRLQTDADLIKKAFNLYGIPKVVLRNVVPVDKAKELLNDYEITTEFRYKLDEDGKIKKEQMSWQIKDDDGEPSYSLMPPPMVVSLIKQLVEVLNI